MARTAWLISTLVFLLLAGGVGVWLNSATSTSDSSENTTQNPSQFIVNDEEGNEDCAAAPAGDNGPWLNDLAIATLSADGTTVETSSTILVERGGVPSIIVDEDDRWILAFQWFPCDDEESFDKIAVIVSEDEGETWSDPELATFAGLPGTYQRPFDPTLVLTPEGKIRMYFTSSSTGAKTFDESIKIYSAISDDGIHYTFEEGLRFGLEEDPAYDTAVAYWSDAYFLVTPHNFQGPHGEANHARSDDGLDFTTQELIKLSEDVNWTGNFVVIGNALRFYGGASGLSGIWWTETTDGETWSDPAYLEQSGGDPTVVCSEEACLVVMVEISQQMQAPQSAPPTPPVPLEN